MIETLSFALLGCLLGFLITRTKTFDNFIRYSQRKIARFADWLNEE
jgi:uncharacterized membrane protein